ncbi:hypothetical protein VTH8203_01466 [Vibrio thalassae]|uniref:Spore protein YkvP/CgeB glycosyl transferase-like domain-containing protein n=1 Tax=Vibrio thalassae TaxID=1243014 RepID=A0A240EH69_9VIBR|nr:glycosyltransferase [Vibrio thalassae]SNX47851.1 hypothetical protein VTH8203_01466 [Vibrio thalassae]
MNVILLSKNYSEYKSGYYHADIVGSWVSQTNCFVYGPGYSNYDSSDEISDVIKKSGFKRQEIDLIVFSTSWDEDDREDTVDPHESISVSEYEDIKRVYYLNKEYKKLDLRFEYIRRQNIDVVVTVHPEYKNWEKETGIKFIKSHFAVNLERFNYNNEKKKYDFGFTGGLHLNHLDYRSKVKMEIFKEQSVKVKSNRGLDGIINRGVIKEKYRDYDIYWAEFGAKNILGKSLLPSGEKYANFLRKFNSFLNTPSAIGIFNTRFFELMASKTLILCPRVEEYDGLMIDGVNCVMFNPDMSDFEDILKKSKMENYRTPIVENAYRMVKEHTYERRVLNILENIGFR